MSYLACEGEGEGKEIGGKLGENVCSLTEDGGHRGAVSGTIRYNENYHHLQRIIKRSFSSRRLGAPSPETCSTYANIASFLTISECIK